jgi:hypothetical protein
MVMATAWIVAVLTISVRDRPRNWVAQYNSTPSSESRQTVEFNASELHALSPVDTDLRYWALRSGIAFLVPALIYLFTFHVVRWVYRGFHSLPPASRTD